MDNEAIELEKLKVLAMDAMQVKKGRRDETKKVLDIFYYCISNQLRAENITISRGRPKLKETEGPSEIRKQPLSASPFASKTDHRLHMAKLKK